MNQFDSDNRQDVIRITREEINNSHVDDLLKRQASLRGESDVSRNRKGKWYYQNWFVFMIAGVLAAGLAWAILEPFFDDSLYIQGPLEELNVDDQLPGAIDVGGRTLTHEFSGTGWVKVNNEKVWILSKARFLRSDGTSEPADLSALKVGQQIGVYVPYQWYSRTHFPVAMFVVPAPVGEPSRKARMSLKTLSARSSAAGLVVFALVAALVGLAVGATDGIVCRLLRRALLAGFVGLLIGFIGGFVSSILANLAYAPLNALAMKQQGDAAGGLSALGFFIQMGGRSLAWSLAGMAMGLGQGIALRSGRILLYGFLGGIIGGLMGGLLFDPIDLLLFGGVDRLSAHWSRLIGFMCVGGGVGAMIGVVELLARDAWLQMIQGPLSGKEFLIFKDSMYLGSSPKSDIYMFNDDLVASRQAIIRSVGDNYEIENLSTGNPTYVNGRPVERTRLRHGDQIAIGRTIFVFQKRKS